MSAAAALVFGANCAIAVVDGDLVPVADVVGVGVRDVDAAVLVERDVGVGIVHHAVGLRDAGCGEVVGEAEGVAGLVGGELANAREHHLEHGIVVGLGHVAGLVGSEQAFGDQVVLASAQRA